MMDEMKKLFYFCWEKHHQKLAASKKNLRLTKVMRILNHPARFNDQKKKNTMRGYNIIAKKNFFLVECCNQFYKQNGRNKRKK